MKRFNVTQINTPQYWDSHQTATDYGLRQQKYDDLAGIGDKIVELGCGLSPFLMSTKFVSKFGVDFSPKTLQEASERYPNVEFILSDCLKTPFIDKYFDVSVAGEVIEHLDDPEALISEMKRITKHKIIISTPNLEFDDPEHLWEFDEQWFRNRGFNTEVVESERFPGRKYIFAVCELL
jgi:ubiquinone/menaquinone biosynthesis C-methylase UbiE